MDRKGTVRNNVNSLFSSLLTSVSLTKPDTQPRTTANLPNPHSSSSNINSSASGTTSGDFFIRMSLSLLQNSKEHRRNETFRNAIAEATVALDQTNGNNPLVVFKPFQMACQSGNVELVIIAVDCLGKLFTYNYWKFAQGVQIDKVRPSDGKKIEGEVEDEDDDGTEEMITYVITSICDSFTGESTDDHIQLQIIKALQAALTTSDSAFSLHGAVLLKVIRTTYNIFLLSKSVDVQIVAQGTVTHMIQNVLGRIAPTANGKDDTFRREFKDAYKVFRTLCILSVKPIPTPEGTIELRSQPIRSKLLALHLVNTVLKSHAYLFLMAAPCLKTLVQSKEDNVKIEVKDETFRFIDSINEFLILSLSRNAASMVLPIFEIALELFSTLWINLRSVLKKEMAVFFTEIVIPILEGRKNIPWYQRYTLMKCLINIFTEQPQNGLTTNGGQMLVEIYLNYDCDVEATAKENIWERLINALSKVTTQHIDSNAVVQPLIHCFVNETRGTPALTTANLTLLSREQVNNLFAPNGDAAELRRQGVRLMAKGILKPLMEWCSERMEHSRQDLAREDKSEEEKKLDQDEEVAKSSPASFDDPTAIGNLKQRKQHIIEGIKRFNIKPKKGIQYFLDTKCIANRTPGEIAKFILDTEGFNKAMIGDYLGEGEEENIAIMHSFVEYFEFVDQGFVESLRAFLQSFRLPGEAQKIDRFMLKFAEIYLKGNSSSFSSADTAYVLAYSVIMLNTDQHNAQVKKKMSKIDFIKNNRGIDGGKDLPEEMLTRIYEEIASNEIIMKDEVKKDTSKDPNEPKNVLVKTSESMALKTEQLMRKGKKTSFIVASHYAHVKPMFEIIWMSVLTGLSTPLQECEDSDTILDCLDGIKNATRIACTFDLELEQNAMVSTLSKFTHLNNIQEMKPKNFEAIRTLLDTALLEGGHLTTSWKDVVNCISQLEKLQILGQNNEETARKREVSVRQGVKTTFIEEAALAASSQSMTLSVDRIFTASPRLSGPAIVHFVRALCETSWDEISSSSDKEQPRMYCLQRLVEISYYNMKRIRVEWSSIWAILGLHFNQVGCYPNTNVALFALDKLRQLAMKFLELDELPNFKFQKDFLRPFEEIVKNNPDAKIKDMCLVCLQQIIQVKGSSIKSGWKTLCGTLMRVARESNETIVNLSFDITKNILKNNLDSINQNGSLSDFVACIVEFCRNKKTAKVNLHAVELLRQCVQRTSDLCTIRISKTLSISSVLSPIGNQMVGTPITESNPLKRTNTATGSFVEGGSMMRRGTVSMEEDICIRYWMPLLFGLHDVIMTCELEARTKALQYLFETLKSQGATFTTSFWEMLGKGVLFPIFEDMRVSSNNTNIQNSKFASKEDLSIWLSTTLIQALRQFVDLFTHYYRTLGFMLDNMLGLLKVCLLHENEALSRIGSTCIQQLIEHNVHNFDEKAWSQISDVFTDLFQETAPTFLFFNYKPDDPTMNVRFSFLKQPLGLAPDRKEFQKQISKCVLHLMVVQTLQDVLSSGPSNSIYNTIPNATLITLLDCFESSYTLARIFNESTELRQALHKMGYMKQLPNLLKQETLSVNAYLIFLIKLFSDTTVDRVALRELAQERLIPLCLDVIKQYNSLESDAKQRNISAWRPVVVLILSAFAKFSDEHFKLHIQKFYPPAIKMLLQEVTVDVRMAIFNILQRTGILFGLSKELTEAESIVPVRVVEEDSEIQS